MESTEIRPFLFKIEAPSIKEIPEIQTNQEQINLQQVVYSTNIQTPTINNNEDK